MMKKLIHLLPKETSSLHASRLFLFPPAAALPHGRIGNLPRNESERDGLKRIRNPMSKVLVNFRFFKQMWFRLNLMCCVKAMIVNKMFPIDVTFTGSGRPPPGVSQRMFAVSSSSQVDLCVNRSDSSCFSLKKHSQSTGMD